MGREAYGRIDQDILKTLPVRISHSNKGTYGKALIIAGSKNMAGAAYLSAYGAYRAGAGLVRIFTPEENRVILQSLLPEAVLTTFDTAHPDPTLLKEAMEWSTVAAIGPGIGQEAWAGSLVEQMMREYHRPLVADADAINYLAAHRHLLKAHEGPLILTPHVGEYSRLTDIPIQELKSQIPEQAARFAREYHCICVLKDAPTCVGDEEGNCRVNTTGNHGMSTGGSGDVLTGIITGLLAQKAKPLDAALLGVWLHGRAGDLAAKTEGTYGLMARHLIEYLPGAMMRKGEDEE